MMKKLQLRAILVAALVVFGLSACKQQPAQEAFLRVEGENIVDAQGNPYYIQGTNLGNWLNPEGYLFGLRRPRPKVHPDSLPPMPPAPPVTDPNCGRWINELFCQLVGPEYTAQFWQQFKDNYITEADIAFLASCGINTVRLPFHYKLFTNEDYLGKNDPTEGFARMDSVVAWSKKYKLHVILDMHDAPGGQTGDNIDDSYGYPWLFVSNSCRQQFKDIWVSIARHFASEPTVLGYELINEPIAHYFADKDTLKSLLEPLYMEVTDAIRQVDPYHIVLWGGAEWNGDFRPFKHVNEYDNILLTCHRYGQAPSAKGIADFIAYRDSVGVAMYMGETGHNTYVWLDSMTTTMRNHNIGFTLWPYKKIEGSSMVGFDTPELWPLVVDFALSDRGTYAKLRALRPDQAQVRKAMEQFLHNLRFENCNIDTLYIQSSGFQVPAN